EPPSQKKSCSRSMGANVYKFKNSEVVSNCNMVRDAHQILSVLKKPVDQANHSRLSVERNLSNCESSSLSPSLAQEKLLKHGTLISSYQECPEKINTNGLPILEAGDVKKCDISGSYQSPKNSEDPKKFSSVNSVNLVDDSLGIRGRLADNSDITSRKPLSSTCVPWRLASAVEVGANIKQETVSHTGHASEVIGTTHENKVHESGALFDLK
ncbi:hypothetical protein AMTR_s00021p00215120, partial [Amborella trichopoda]